MDLLNDRSSIDSTRELALSRRGCPEQFNSRRGRPRSKLVCDLFWGKRWSADRCNLQGWPVSHPGTSAANSSLSEPPVCMVLSGALGAGRVASTSRAKIKFKSEGGHGLHGLEQIKVKSVRAGALGGLSDRMSDSLGAGGLRETNTEFGCLFPVASGASCEALLASQPTQSEGLTLNPKCIRVIRVPKDVEFDFNPKFICGSKARCNA